MKAFTYDQLLETTDKLLEIIGDIGPSFDPTVFWNNVLEPEPRFLTGETQYGPEILRLYIDYPDRESRSQRNVLKTLLQLMSSPKEILSLVKSDDETLMKALSPGEIVSVFDAQFRSTIKSIKGSRVSNETALKLNQRCLGIIENMGRPSRLER